MIVIGGGPGGYVAALEVARLGGRACLIESEALGGTCLNKGCIPTKTLLASAEVLSKFRKAEEFGFSAKNITIDISKILKRKDAVVNRLGKGIAFLLKKANVDVFMGKGRLKGKNEVEVVLKEGASMTLSGENIIIATGSRPSIHPSFNYDGDTVITSEEALELNSIPDSVLIIGGGVIGCEFACFYSEFGSEVTIVEMEESIIPTEERDISSLLTTAMKKRNIRIETNMKVESVQKKDGKAYVTLTSGDTLVVDKVLISTGRMPNTEGLGLEEVGILKGSKNEIIVNDNMGTNMNGIYAIGDVTGKMLLAHVASAQGVTAAENIMGIKTKMDYKAIPRCIFTFPEVASVGMTTQEATAANFDVKVGRYSFISNGKALAIGQGEGIAKVLVDGGTGDLLGVHIIGPNATELIAEATVALQLDASADDLARTVHAHPTLAETLKEAAWGVEY